MKPETTDENVPQTDVLAARQITFAVLEKVLGQRQPLDQTLDREQGFSHLSQRDRAFARMLISTTLRRLGQIDDMIRRAMEREEPPSPPQIQTVMRMGIAQIVFMDVPDHAAVDTAVRMADEIGMSRQKGLVNAVMRRATRDIKDWLSSQDETRLNTPQWLMQQWITGYGLRAAAEIAQANLAEAPLDISIKDESQRDHWAQTLDASALPTGTLRRASGGNVQDLPGYEDGMWWIQDASAALPAKLFGHDLTGKTVIDLCAAPGGKTAQLAAQGANVIALDRSVKRLKRLEDNMHRLRLQDHVKTEAADAAVWQPKEKANFILLDAPCTATGTIRRHPDILWLKTERDLESLIDVQKRILDNAVHMLALGGVLIYCTCSLQKAEGETQIEMLLNDNSSMQRIPFQPEEIGNVNGILNENGELRILPTHLTAHGGMDGFFVARLQKRA